MDHSHYLHVNIHVSWESARDTLSAKWNGNGFRSPGKTILVAIESTSVCDTALRKLQYKNFIAYEIPWTLEYEFFTRTKFLRLQYQTPVPRPLLWSLSELLLESLC